MSHRLWMIGSATLAAFVAFGCGKEAEAPDESMSPAALEEQQREAERRASELEAEQRAAEERAAEAQKEAEQAGQRATEAKQEAEQAGQRAIEGSGVLTAVESLTDARCDREQRCNNVGPDKKYSSRADCVMKVNEEWREDLNARQCPGGVVQSEFSECLEEIRNEDCGNPFDSLERIVACRASDICESKP